SRNDSDMRIVQGAAMVTALVMAGVGSGVPDSAATQQGLAWGPCPAAPGVVLDARQECANLRVPLDYNNAGRDQITLAVSRIGTSTPESRRGVLLLIPGGP